MVKPGKFGHLQLVYRFTVPLKGWNYRVKALGQEIALFIIYRSNRLQIFFKVGVFKNLTIFTGKHLCWSPVSIEKNIYERLFFEKKNLDDLEDSCNSLAQEQCNAWKSFFLKIYYEMISVKQRACFRPPVSPENKPYL